MKLTFTLPKPPSLNGLYANRKGGRRKTDRYNMWIANAGVLLEGQMPAIYDPHEGDVKVSITLNKGAGA